MAETKQEDLAIAFTLKNAGCGFEGRSSDVFAGLDALEQQHFTYEHSRTDTEAYANLKPDCDDGFVEEESCEKSRSSSGQQRKGDDDQKRRCHSSSFEVAQRGNAESDKHCSLKKYNDRDSFSRDGGRDSFRKHDRSDKCRDSQGRVPQRPDTQFRRPREITPGRRNRLPDHCKHPENWTYYSLEDVTELDMSENSNSQAALAYLDDRRKLREQQDIGLEAKKAFDVGSGACSRGLFSFAKRSKTSYSDCKMSDKNKLVAGGLEQTGPGRCAVTKASSEGEQDEASDKSPITRLSGKSTIAIMEDETFGKSTTANVEDETSGKSTIASMEEEASGKSVITSVDKDKAAGDKPAFKRRKGIWRNIRFSDDKD